VLSLAVLLLATAPGCQCRFGHSRAPIAAVKCRRYLANNRHTTGLYCRHTRLLTPGLTLAGVYPVGMKIVASWFRGGLGFGLSVMVGALTIGTSLPFLLKALGASLPWQSTVALASAAAFLGAFLVFIGVRDGPHLPAKAEFDASMIWKLFRVRRYRLAAFGYFGHMRP
jgi:MFS family permease